MEELESRCWFLRCCIASSMARMVLKCSLVVSVLWRSSGPTSAEPSMNFEQRLGRPIVGEDVGDDILFGVC